MLGAARWIPAPGYMDAEYYYATSTELVQGRGFVEPFVWNFLSDAASIPTPAHTYWQPLASLVSAASMTLFGNGFRGAQVLGVLLAALIPVLSARLAVGLGEERRTALLAGVLALLPGFYAPYLVTTDTFALYAVIGGILWWQIEETGTEPSIWRWMLVGAMVALGSLARADGLLLWVPVGVALLSSPAGRWRAFGLAAVGFGMLMAPWWLRNLTVTGSFLGAGTTRALWMLEYDELFLFPASQLTFARWWAAGPATLLLQRLQAVWINLQSALVVNGYVLLLPLTLVGGWAHRRRPSVRAAIWYAAALFLFMSFAFPFAGSRGGFFHSSAALMPLVYALVAVGLRLAAKWIAPRLRWDADRTRRLLATVALLLAASLSLWALLAKTGSLGTAASFARDRETYAGVHAALIGEIPKDPIIAGVNPPALYLATGLRSVALPHGSEAALLQVIERFGVDWIVLEWDHPAGLEELYAVPGEREWLAAPLRLDDPAGRPVYLYRVLETPA
jgi:4-amino-4-deoxy-L-arabinose transferase-like glycosyltransferase